METICQDWPWPDVKSAIEKAGTTLSAIAVAAGKSPSAAWRVKDLPLPTVQCAIAKVIGIPAHEIWPSRYRSDGRPVRRRDWLRDFRGRAT